MITREKGKRAALQGMSDRARRLTEEMVRSLCATERALIAVEKLERLKPGSLHHERAVAVAASWHSRTFALMRSRARLRAESGEEVDKLVYGIERPQAFKR